MKHTAMVLWVCSVAVLLLASNPGLAAGLARQQTSLDPNRRAELLERWRAKDPAERLELQQRFLRLKELDPEARAALERRAQAVRAGRRHLVDGLPRGWSERFASLSPMERERALRDWHLGAAHLRGQRLRMQHRSALEAVFHGASPEERSRVFEHWREKRSARMLDLGLSELDRKLQLGPERLEALRNMEPSARRAEILGLRRQALRQDAARSGPPLGLDGARWAELELLSDESFFAALREVAREQVAGLLEEWGGPRAREPRGPARAELVAALAELLDPAADGSRSRLSPLRPNRGELADWIERNRAGGGDPAVALGAWLKAKVTELANQRPDLDDRTRQLLVNAEPRELSDALHALAPWPWRSRVDVQPPSGSRRPR